MGLRRVLMLLFLTIAVAVGLYYFSGDSSTQPQKSNHIHTDSIAAPDRPTIAARSDTQEVGSTSAADRPANPARIDTQDTVSESPKPVKEDFAPGTASIRATIQSVELADGLPSKILVTINEVMGYGPATPPLVAGTELSLQCVRLLKNKPDKKKVLQEGAVIQAVITSQQKMMLGESNSRRGWEIIELN